MSLLARRQNGRYDDHHALSLYNGQIFRKSQPPLKKFFEKERYGRSSLLKRMGRGAPAAVPVKACQLPSHSPIAEFL